MTLSDSPAMFNSSGRLAQRALASPAELESSPSNVLDLSRSSMIGAAQEVLELTKRALDAGATHYTPAEGIPELRAAVAADLGRNGIPVDEASIGITNGAGEAMYLALQRLVHPGDRGLHMEPAESMVHRLLRYLGAAAIPVQANVQDRFIPEFRDSALDGVALLILSTPNVISGVEFPPAQLKQILDAARERGVTVILDRSLAIGALQRDVEQPDLAFASHTVILGSFSGLYGLDGWRIGYYSAPAELTGPLSDLKTSMSICTPAVSQWAALAALETRDNWLPARLRACQGRLEFVRRRCAEIGVNVVAPDAAPPLLVDVRTAGDDKALTARLLTEYGVRVEAGSSVGSSTRGFLRLNLNIATSVLEEGLERVTPVIEREIARHSA